MLNFICLRFFRRGWSPGSSFSPGQNAGVVGKRLLGYTNLLLAVLLCGVVLAGCSRNPNVRKQKYYNSGMEYLKKGRANEAAIQFRNALKVDPRFAEAATSLGEIQLQQRDARGAYALFQQAVKSNPDYLPARKSLGNLFLLAAKAPEAQKEA